MTLTLSKHPEKTSLPSFTKRSDEELVRGCLDGDSEAWSELIDKYKNLIFSVPIKYGFSREEAADIFQDVCLGLLSQLGSIREPKALAKWLLMVTAHKCSRWRARDNRFVSMESETFPEANFGEMPPEALEILTKAEKEQMLRESISALPARCRRLVQMLFFDDPPLPYRDVAETLGIATGSIGFIRQRCLARLRKALSSLGFGSCPGEGDEKLNPAVPGGEDGHSPWR
jgi:RNA polymerase sigma factor (sigma-70 family)